MQRGTFVDYKSHKTSGFKVLILSKALIELTFGHSNHKVWKTRAGTREVFFSLFKDMAHKAVPTNSKFFKNQIILISFVSPIAG